MIRHILPAEKANFKVDCKGCDDEPLPEYSSFTVKVVSAL
jgi:hypothetical protein